MEGSSLWENVYTFYKMPVSFLGLILDRAGGRQLEVHFRSCDYLHSVKRREGYFKTIQPIADRIKSFTVHVTASEWGKAYLCDLFSIPYPNLESLDLSHDAFNPPSPRRYRGQRLYQPDTGDAKETVILQLITSTPAGQLKNLTLRHMKGWPPTNFGNLTNLTLFGYADGTALAEAVPANPALQKLKLESIKYKERYSYDLKRLVKLDGQTLELARCEPGALNMFTLSSTCSLVITRTMDKYTIAYEGEVPDLRWLPEDVSAIRCLHELEEVHFSVTKTPRKKGWIAAEQKTVGYSTPNLTSGRGAEPSVTFVQTYYSDARAPLYEIPFKPKYLLPHTVPWGQVTRASLSGFHEQFSIRDNVVFKTLSNLRSLTLRCCDSGHLVRFITPDELRGLESLRLEDELSGADFGDVLSKVFELRYVSAGLRLKDLKLVTSGGPGSTITAEQVEELKEWIYCIDVIKAPGYRSVVITK